MATKTLEELQLENAELRKENGKLKNVTTKLNTALKVAEATKGKGARPVVEIDGKHYEVRSGERTAKGVVKREELMKNRARLKELVAAGSGILKEVAIN